MACPTGSAGFTFIERLSDIGAWQGCAFDGEFYYTTALIVDDDSLPEAQFYLQKWDAELNLVLTRNFAGEGDAAHNQINGIYYDSAAHRLYVGANNYNDTPERGWVFQVDPDDLSVLDYDELSGGKWTEGVWFHNGSWWEVNASGHEIREFNTSFVLQATHALPDTSPGTDGSGLFWNGIFVLDDIFYVNLHEGTNSPDLRGYSWNGSGFDAETITVTPPTSDTTQGIFYDGCRAIYWAERVFTGADQGNIVVTTAVDALTLYGVPYTEARVGEAFAGFTVTGFNGTAPYSYDVSAGTIPPGLSINSSTGAVTGTPITSGSYTFTLRVTDDVAATNTIEDITIEVYPSSLTGYEVTVDAADVDARLYGFPLKVDLADMPASFWLNVDSDGGNIRAYGEHGSTQLPIDMVTIDTGAETGCVIVRTDLNDNHSTIIAIRLDGAGLIAAADPFGRHEVWPTTEYEAVYGFVSDLIDRTANGNDLTVNTGSVTYSVFEKGIGGGIDTDGGNFQAVNTALANAAKIFLPATMMVTGKRTTETAQNQFAFSLGTSPTGDRHLCLGENNGTGKWSLFEASDFNDGTTSSTLNTDVIMHGQTRVGQDSFYVNGSLENGSFLGFAPNATSDTLAVGNALSASYWRGPIGVAYLSTQDRTAAWVDAEAASLSGTLTTIADNADTPPGTPTVTITSVAGTGVSATTSAFSSGEGGSHVATQWRITRVSDGVVVYNPGDDTSNLTSIVNAGSTVPLDTDNVAYKLEARHGEST